MNYLKTNKFDEEKVMDILLNIKKKKHFMEVLYNGHYLRTLLIALQILKLKRNIN